MGVGEKTLAKHGTSRDEKMIQTHLDRNHQHGAKFRKYEKRDREMKRKNTERDRGRGQGLEVSCGKCVREHRAHDRRCEYKTNIIQTEPKIQRHVRFSVTARSVLIALLCFVVSKCCC